MERRRHRQAFVADLERWLADLREWEKAGGDDTIEPWQPHDDVTVVRVRPVS
jgi:hypothetical protein